MGFRNLKTTLTICCKRDGWKVREGSSGPVYIQVWLRCKISLFLLKCLGHCSVAVETHQEHSVEGLAYSFRDLRGGKYGGRQAWR